MYSIDKLAWLVVRQASDVSSSAATGTPMTTAGCTPNNEFDGRIAARISALFVILIGSFFGAVFPVYAHHHRGLKVPEWAFFIAKYFGSGVIIATAFIHLLAPANEALSNPCLTGPITAYSWVEGIALMTIFVLFFTEFFVMRYSVFGHTHNHDHEHGPDHPEHPQHVIPTRSFSNASHGYTPGDDHLGHSREHVGHEMAEDNEKPSENYHAAMTAIFILEFGVVFHSVFVGLTLAVAGAEFNTLYVVLVFHQTFEGLGLGTRLAAAPWPRSKRMMPYYMAIGYSLSTPIALAVGLGVRNTYAPGSQTALIVNGVFDSISAGILIYTGLVELMAHEFMFSEVMRKASMRVILSAFGMMCLGAGLMALLGKWA